MIDHREVEGGMRIAALAVAVMLLLIAGALAWIIGTLLSVLAS